MTATSRLNIRQYGLRSLWYHRRVNLAVMLGMIVGTAVLTGALIVGDSVRYSLRRLTLERLGRIDEILLADHFFSADLADNWSRDGRTACGVSGRRAGHSAGSNDS